MKLIHNYFSLGNILNWRTFSDNQNWINQNIEEFRSSHIQQQNTNDWDIEINEVAKIKVNAEAIYISDEQSCLPDTVYLKDKYSNKKISILIKNDNYIISIEQGFTFYYYAAILDAFIKILAFYKGVIAFHASAFLKDNKSYVFGSWRQIGKTSIILNLLKNDDEIEILADDAVFLTKEGELIPYLRGIDLYPYLPISEKYLSEKERAQRLIAKWFLTVPLVPKKLKTKILKRFLLPRLNLARFDHGNFNEGNSIEIFAVKKNKTNQTIKKHMSESDMKSFLGKSSYFEFIEYLEPFKKVCSVFPDSGFSKLLFDYDDFQQKVDLIFGSNSSTTELNLSNNYSDLNNLSQVI